jgi:acyl carrier protein
MCGRRAVHSHQLSAVRLQRCCRGALACGTLRAPSAAISTFGERPSPPKEAHCHPLTPPRGRISSSNCGAIATLSRLLRSATLRGGLLGRIRFNELGGLIMTIASLTSSDQATAIATFAANDVRILIANHLGISVGRVTDNAHLTHDLGADWLDRLELMVAVEDQFVGVEITDDAVDRIEVVGDLIRHIETMDSERRRRGAAPVFSKLFGPHLARAMKPIMQQEGGEQAALFFLRLAGEAMRSLMGWCRETRQPVDLQIYVDDATLTRIWFNVVRFQCPHCGTKHETKVERLASRPLSFEPPKTRHQRTRLVGRMQSR